MRRNAYGCLRAQAAPALRDALATEGRDFPCDVFAISASESVRSSLPITQLACVFDRWWTLIRFLRRALSNARCRPLVVVVWAVEVVLEAVELPVVVLEPPQAVIASVPGSASAAMRTRRSSERGETM